MGRLFNNENLKLSYSCTRNVQRIISAHNRKVISKHNQVAAPRQQLCNCRAGVASCPAGGSCLEEGVVYEATVTAPGKVTRTYIGSSSTSLKTRINNHHCDFRNRGREHATTLSTHVWKLKDEGAVPAVSYKIMGKAKPYSPNSRNCALCTLEKLYIVKADEATSLNKRSEIANKCRHRAAHTLFSMLGKKTPPDKAPARRGAT